MKLLFQFKELNCVYIIGECNQCLFKVLLYLNWAQFETFYFVMKFKVGRGRKWKIGQGLRLLWSISKFHLSPPKSLQVLEPLKILTWFRFLRSSLRSEQLMSSGWAIDLLNSARRSSSETWMRSLTLVIKVLQPLRSWGRGHRLTSSTLFWTSENKMKRNLKLGHNY